MQIFFPEKLREFDVSLKTAQDMSDNYQQELKEYKEKAARILQVITMTVYFIN